MTELPSVEPHLPPRVLDAVTALWDANLETEAQAIASGRFRLLGHVCASVYPTIPGSRLSNPPARDFDRHEFQEALRRFFRWIGAPWHTAGPCPSAQRAAEQLHAAFLTSKVKRSYLVPLDRLALEDDSKSPSEDLQHLRFGTAEIILLEKHQFAEHIPVAALQRFEQRHWFEPEKYAGFHYLVVSEEEQAKAIWERSMWRIWHKTFGPIGNIELYKPIYPELVEDALFLILLYLLTNPTDHPFKPFAVPWVYSFTGDPFSEPPRAPDPSALSWTIAGLEGREYEVPDRSNSYSFAANAIETALRERWDRLQGVITNFNPLTKHFFMKAFQEEGVDEMISLISCLEATFMLRGEHKGREKMMARCDIVLGNNEAFAWLQQAYPLRDTYLHGYGDPKDQTCWDDMAKVRWAVARAVDCYLALAATREQDDRKTLLKSLKL